MARSVFAVTCSGLASVEGLLKAKSNIQDTAKVRLKPVQGRVPCALELKEVGEGVFKAG